MRLVGLLVLLIVHLSGLFFFCSGFFPSKIVLQGFGSFNSDTGDGDFDTQFDKVVVMVVDALRSDFMFSTNSSMNFVHQLINKGSALGFTAYSNPPTVTLPRLKGITTGSTPNFLDAVLNVVEGDESSNLMNQDSWLKQLKLNGKKINMFGDDTWNKLFPSFFDEFEGTSSFFVSDFTEVDNNVTRHLDQQLSQQSKWDCLILHYLGLDHIGHKGGPNSIFMKPKQKEMDLIIERIYNELDDRTLFVVLGDHGMNELGNHGGSSVGETSAAMVFISDKLQKIAKPAEKKLQAPLEYDESFNYFKRIQQIDLVPTIATLLHLPIPKNSLGIFIQDLLSLWDHDLKQRQNVLLGNIGHFKNFDSDIENYRIDDSNSLNEDEIYENLRGIQSRLTKSASNYNMSKIFLGLGIGVVSASLSILLTIKQFKKSSAIFIGSVILYSIYAFGSSLVEEEHQLWWWFSISFLTLLSYSQKSNFLILTILLRILRGWNNSGQKYVGDTIANYLQSYTYLNWILIIITITSYAFNFNTGGLSLRYPGISFGISFFFTIITLTFKLMFSIANGDAIPRQLIRFAAYSIAGLGVKTAEEALVPMARMFYCVVLASVIIRIGTMLKGGNKSWLFTDFHNLICFILIFQTSVNNIGIFLVLMGIKLQLGLIFLNYSQNGSSTNNWNRIGLITLSTIILQNFTFFSFGQTNSLATVDLSNSYNGVTSYNIYATGVLTFLSNFAGPIYWSFASLPIIFENRENLKTMKYEVTKIRWTITLLFFSLSTLTILVSCFIQRYHLFIWTVFSPKVLYTVVWNIFISCGVELVALGLVALY